MILKSCELAGRSGHVCGRLLLAELYREATGSDLPPIATGEWGKPYFPDSDWHFSISHTKDHAFCALSNRPIGMDAEELSRQVKPALAEKILSPAEMAQYEESSDRNRALLTFWVLKLPRSCRGKGFRAIPTIRIFPFPTPA